MNKLINIVIALLFCANLYGQTTNSQESEVKVLARHQSNRNLIRWATTSPSSWMKGIKYGYKIERYTFYRDGVRLTTPEKKVLNQSMLPKPLAAWENMVSENDYAAILAQAIYGESFEVGGVNNGQDALLQIINKARESEQRFAFGLFAADMSFEAALMAGLGFIDEDIKPNEDYFYKVIPKTPAQVLPIKSGGTLVKSSEDQSLPKPIDLFTVAQDKTIMLSWDCKLFENLYVAYFVERSADGKNFKKLNKRPLVNMNQEEGKSSSKMIYMDSIPENNKKYYYRIVGVTSFGEESVPSEISERSGIKKLEAVPRINKYNFLKDGSVQLNWEFKKEAEKEISGFEINRGATEKGPFKAIITSIAPNKRTYKLGNLEPSNYFTVSAIGVNNQKTTSLTKFIQTIDSIPPVKPVGLVAKIDTMGVVRLKWNPNLEKDLLGYRIYRANLEKEEYVQLTVSPIAQENFDDNVQLKSLNDKVFYKVVAVDKRFNMSDYSNALVVKKPDVVPPSAPFFKGYKVEEGKVNLTWIKSNSNDVAFYKLYKKSLGSQNQDWELLFSTENESSYSDTELEGKKRYRYAIFAEDESGLVSEASTPITITAKSSTNVPKLIKRVNGLADRTNNKIDLSWSLADQVQEIVIYKAKNEEKPILFRQFSIKIKSVEDVKVNPGNNYNYTIKVSDNQGNTQFKKIGVTY